MNKAPYNARRKINEYTVFPLFIPLLLQLFFPLVVPFYSRDPVSAILDSRRFSNWFAAEFPYFVVSNLSGIASLIASTIGSTFLMHSTRSRALLPLLVFPRYLHRLGNPAKKKDPGTSVTWKATSMPPKNKLHSDQPGHCACLWPYDSHTVIPFMCATCSQGRGPPFPRAHPVA